MGESFDEEVERAWSAFEARLARCITGAIGEPVVIGLNEQPDDGAAPYVQVCEDDGAIVAEASSNRFLGTAYKLARVHKQGLAALGWRKPGDEIPNYSIRVDAEDRELLVSTLVGTLRHVFGVIHPEFLTWSASEQKVAPIEADPEFAYPATSEVLRGLIETVAAGHYGQPLDTDDDGDLVVMAGAHPAWIRVAVDQPVVRIFSLIALDVRSRTRARLEADVLNRRHTLVKFHVEGRSLVARLDLPAMPFVADHLRGMLDVFAHTLDSIGPDAALRTGGRTFFEDGRASA